MEAVKGLANPRDGGEISDPRQIKSVGEYLAAHSANPPEDEKDEMNRQTKLKAKGDVLVHTIRLEHR
ncbi:MAG: hypothetical protein JOZ02_05765 [Acidobacteria bacterium]|nr:hypothetical protein [Acidobacteriota bacterium]